nr:MAG TPA: Bcl-2-like protein [Caudoviricetes sp.]
MMFIICLQKNFKICIDKMIFWVYNRGGWAGIDNKNK